MLISAYSTRHESLPHPFAATDQRSRRSANGEPDAELTTHLDALAAYATEQGDRQLARQLADTKQWYSFELDDADPAQLAQLGTWASDANAVLLINGALLDAQGRPLLAGEHGPATGVLPVLAESADRAAQIREWLVRNRQVPVVEGLAPVRSSAEVEVQEAGEVGRRIIALVLVNDFSASVLAGRPIDPRLMQAAFPQGFEALSPTERALFDSADQGLARQLLPRIEAAQELLWAISRITFGWPAQPCQVDEIKRIVLAPGEQGFLTGIELRPLDDLLNEYECLASLMHSVDDLRRNGGAPIPETDPIIAGERLSAMSWLLNRGLAWDDADALDRMA